MSQTFQVTLSASQLLNAAQALRENAGVAYDDERLCTAQAQYRMARDFYALLGMEQRAEQCGNLARAIDAEQRAIAAGEEEAV